MHYHDIEHALLKFNAIADEDLVILAITDYGLTRRFSDNTEQSYRKAPQNLEKAVLI